MSNDVPAEQPWDDEWDEWYRLTPQERWQETQKLWEYYLNGLP